MRTLRQYLAGHRGLAALFIAAALLLRVLVPAGYMPVAANGSVVLVLCSGRGPEAMAAMPGMARDHGGHDRGGASDTPCAFSALTAPSLAAADPIVLAAAIAFVMAAIYRFLVTDGALRRAFLRPPPRGPPGTA